MGVATIAPGLPFADTLARGLLDRLGDAPFALADVTIYLPTRRAARTFGDAFARQARNALLLPSFRALGDVDDDDAAFAIGADDLTLPPAIAPLRRTLLLATLIRKWQDGMGFAQSTALGDALAAVMDETETQGADLKKLDAMMTGALATHWNAVRKFLTLIDDAWPAILAAEGAINPAARRNMALAALAKRLRDNPPAGPVIAAGSTGSIPATAELLKVIAGLPQGDVVLPGLDRALDPQSWDALDAGHPQYGMKQLLARMGIDRGAVREWSATPASSRERVLREALRPAPTTDAWRAIADRNEAGVIAEGLRGLSLIVANDPAQEALAIALVLREALCEPARTAALVTPDRTLARRVAAELARWQIEADDSAGRPLSHTPPGTFLCLLADAAAGGFAPVPLLALLKHPLCTMGMEAAAFRAEARVLDRLLRGPRPDGGLEGLRNAIARAREAAKPEAQPRLSTLHYWFTGVADALRPLERALSKPHAALADIVAAHLACAEALAGDALRAGEAGDAAATFIDQLQAAAVALPDVEPSAYAPLFARLCGGVSVRSSRQRHPRVSILGPLEARLQRFDTIVLGGLNEGTWPRAAGTDPWFSRPMRGAIGLEQPERAIGQAAHDFAMLSAGPRVVLTRASKADGAPTVASRWLQRLEQLAAGLEIKNALKPASDYLAWARLLRDAGPAQRMTKPAPTPPSDARPNRLPVTDIETWVRDPYAIYAKRILRLRPLDALDAPVGPLERGNAIHKAMELFVAHYPGPLSPTAALDLIEIAERVFVEQGVPKAVLAVWRPRFAGAAAWFVEMERQRRDEIRSSHVELKGALEIVPGFTLEARADRIDVLTDGQAAVIDYKTGSIPAPKQIKAFLAPQMPLEAAILAGGGFAALGPMQSAALFYVKLSGGRERGDLRDIGTDMTAEIVARLTQRIADFRDPSSAYLPRVAPLRAGISGDYDHLSRVREWSISGWSEE